jgi:hypothetical protein
MDDVDLLVGLARGLADEIVGLAAGLLSAGIDIEHVHGRYVIIAVELLADAEAHGVLAAGGEQAALEELARVVRVLTDLRDEARAEADPSRG